MVNKILIGNNSMRGGRYIVCLNKNWDGRQCLTHTSGVPNLDYN